MGAYNDQTALRCDECGGRVILNDSTNGENYCANCGTLMEVSPPLEHPPEVGSTSAESNNSNFYDSEKSYKDINQLIKKYNIPKKFDLLSIDIDFNDYWVWKAITNYHPNVVVIEFNSSLPPTESSVVQYDPEAIWDGTNYFGASLLALQNLGHTKGYTLLGCDSNGVNAFFCKNDLIDGIKINDIQYLYKPPKYGKIVNGIHIGHPPSDKKMIKI